MNQNRVQLIVYLKKFNVSNKVAQYGHVIYSSRKMNYTCLYINESDKDQVVSKLKSLHGVQKVEVSPYALSGIVEK
ncbi:MAG TPA: DUF2129 domain-containing protein [Firmicutes bacterium]|nr:DUF2129 domain-containing protein [Bacillota bacterium]